MHPMTSRNINNDTKESQMTLNADAVQRELPIDEQCLSALRNRDLRLRRADRKILCRVMRQKGSEAFFVGGLLGIEMALFILIAGVLITLGDDLDLPVLRNLAVIALCGAVFPAVMQILRSVLHSFRPIRTWLTRRAELAQDRAEHVLSEISGRIAHATD
ncbi:hypothetical protein AZG88_09105 [Rhodococcus sp. LB1]|nr:hypothetical protein AZG88_09105 [Rhodococcus sp. LB1]